MCWTPFSADVNRQHRSGCLRRFVRRAVDALARVRNAMISMSRLFFELVNKDGGYEAVLFVLSECQWKHVADVDAKILIGFV